MVGSEFDEWGGGVVVDHCQKRCEIIFVWPLNRKSDDQINSQMYETY